VRMSGAVRPNAVLVPQQAVLQGAQGFFVWVVDSGSKAQVRGVEVGDWQGDDWFITKGLSKGDRVITDGLMRLAKGVTVKIVQPVAEQPAAATGHPGKAGD